MCLVYIARMGDWDLWLKIGEIIPQAGRQLADSESTPQPQ